jgi:HlyD family secretion protein
MPPNRRSQRDLSFIPQSVSAATEGVTQPVVAFQALRAAASFRGGIRETIVGLGALADVGVRVSPAERAQLHETIKFASPASGVEPRRASSQAEQQAYAAQAASRSARSERAAAPRPMPAPGKQLDTAPAFGAPEPSPERGAAAADPERAVPPPFSAAAPPPFSAAAPPPFSAVAPPVGAAAPGRAAAGAGLFRSAALDARRADAVDPGLGANVKAKSWSLLLLILSLVALSAAGAALASVEVTAEAQGVLRAPNGLRPVASVLAGAVTDVLVRSGDAVEAGQVIARLESTELRASLEARQRELELVRDDVARSSRHDEQLEAESSRALSRRRATLRERIELNAERREQRRARDESLAALVLEGGASRSEGMAAKEALQDASELVSSLGSELAQLDLEIADRSRQSQERESLRRTQLGRAEASAEEARTLLAATEIHAPAAGRIESLLAAPGAVVAAGGVLGNIVPNGAPRAITGFIPSREIAFVQPGAPANVEVQSLSVSEFGLAKAIVTRVSTDVATAVEVQSALGEAPAAGPFVRVELELLESDASGKMEPLLRSGERVKIRLHRRERRLITLLFDFVRRWVA